MLPARVKIAPSEALDSYLERVAMANDVMTKDLFRLLTEERDGGTPSAAFMLIKPSNAMVTRIEELTGLVPNDVENATLARYDGGLPLNLDGFNPLDRHSFRNVVSRGWFPQHGTQACPMCLAQDGVWRLPWRLQLSTVCLEHGTYLAAHCSGCADRFRSRHHSPLRPDVGIDLQCGNPLGVHAHCEHSILTEVAADASGEVLRAASRIANAIDGEDTTVLDGVLRPAEYLVEVKNLTTLLLHLSSRPHRRHFVDWACEVQDETAARGSIHRGPRWGIRPPASPAVRASALAEADLMLSQRAPEAAVRRLTEWFDLIPNVPGGPRGWLVNRSAMSPVLNWLATQALSARRHVGLQLDHQGESSALPLSAIPQLLDERTYRRHFAGMLGTQESTGRLYASLCLARARKPGSSWSAAATSIGLDPDIGRRTSRAASTRLLVAPPVLADAVRAASAELPRRRNYRLLERRVVELARSYDNWFVEWSSMTKPRRRSVALPYAITWMWCEVAQAWLDTSPAWPPPVTRQSKAAYRVFRDTLPVESVRALRALARGVSV